jgi:hypothetical protein
MPVVVAVVPKMDLEIMFIQDLEDLVIPHGLVLRLLLTNQDVLGVHQLRTHGQLLVAADIILAVLLTVEMVLITVVLVVVAMVNLLLHQVLVDLELLLFVILYDIIC